MCGGGTTVAAPQPTAEETKLMGLQADMAQYQMGLMQGLTPLMLEQAGYRQVQAPTTYTDNQAEIDRLRAELQGLQPKPVYKYDEFGSRHLDRIEVDNIRKRELESQIAALSAQTPEAIQGAISYERIPGYKTLEDQQLELEQKSYELNQKVVEGLLSSQEAEQAYRQEQLSMARHLQEPQMRIAELQADRLERALKGELPVSEASQIAREKSEAQMLEGLSRRGVGPGETPYIQSMGEHERTWEALYDAERRGEIAQGSGLFAQAVGLASPTGMTQGVGTQGVLGQGYGLLPTLSSSMGVTQQGLASAMQPYQYYSGLQNQANMYNAQIANQPSGFGQVLGMAGGAALGFALPGIGTALGSGLGGLFQKQAMEKFRG